MANTYPEDGAGPIDTGQTEAGGEGGSTAEALKRQASAAREAARGKIGEYGEAVKQEAQHFAGQAKETAAAQVETKKGAVTGALEDFAEAIRRAGDELGQRDQGMASHVVRQAADGLQGVSRTLADKRPSELLEAVRDYGRRNPAMFIAGSVVAGLALGRFLRASGDAGSGMGESRSFMNAPGTGARADSPSQRGFTDADVVDPEMPQSAAQFDTPVGDPIAQEIEAELEVEDRDLTGQSGAAGGPERREF